MVNQVMLLNIIEHTQDQPAALLLDSLGYQHNDSTTQTCNNRYIAVYRIPPNTTGYSHVMYYCLDHLNRKYVNIINYIDNQVLIQLNVLSHCLLVIVAHNHSCSVHYIC